ncbi:rhomboid family intramembrane serine protease [Actinomyces sp. HMT897]|uniref:rhomboid family intramembrane serine protease n=1 Tax=Actinomyces sp. HMT897 TaxID=2789424 RepID=UPI00190B775A|nr:rhomboid family intramembrane serine protease [Actinomyces sp. HMT897]QQO76900.1 rhomboid family intramembrane serine protease [Actinomyces sp. HMT897]
MTQQYPSSSSGADHQADPPVCPRHPQRVSYVRCQRCNRPVCPECQVPSPVGVRCVDCTHQTGGRGTRTVLGGQPISDVRVTTLLMAVCIVVWILQSLPLRSHLMNPVTAWGDFVPALAAQEPWRFLTTAFLHGGFMHLAFNMYALWVLGGILEPLLGRCRFTALYVLSALGGSTAIYWLASPQVLSAWFSQTVGASGAIFGLFAALFVIQRHLGRDTSGIVALLAVNVVISFLGSGISWQGHLGGLLTGAAVAAVYSLDLRCQRTTAGIMGIIGVTATLVGLIILRMALV